MSNVAIEAKVVDAAHLLVCFNFCHYYICVLLVRPLLAKQLVKVDCLKRTHLSSVFDKLIQVPLLRHLALLALSSESYARVLSCDDALVALLLIVLCCHLTDILEDLST